MYALQEEPERKNRLWILLVGLILGLGLQGGGLWAAHTYQPPEKKRKQVLIEMTVIEKKKPPPPPPPPSRQPCLCLHGCESDAGAVA